MKGIPDIYLRISSEFLDRQMHLIELFYAEGSDECIETLDLLEQTVDENDDVIMIAYDVETEEGLKKARELDISSVPTMIVDGHRIIRGVPHDQAQIFGDEQEQ